MNFDRFQEPDSTCPERYTYECDECFDRFECTYWQQERPDEYQDYLEDMAL